MLILWCGIAAYFFLFWYAVGDLALTAICTFFFVGIGLKMSFAILRDRALIRQSQPDLPEPEPETDLGAANLNQPPEHRHRAR